MFESNRFVRRDRYYGRDVLKVTAMPRLKYRDAEVMKFRQAHRRWALRDWQNMTWGDVVRIDEYRDEIALTFPDRPVIPGYMRKS